MRCVFRFYVPTTRTSLGPHMFFRFPRLVAFSHHLCELTVFLTCSTSNYISAQSAYNTDSSKHFDPPPEQRRFPIPSHVYWPPTNCSVLVDPNNTPSLYALSCRTSSTSFWLRLALHLDSTPMICSHDAVIFISVCSSSSNAPNVVDVYSHACLLRY